MFRKVETDFFFENMYLRFTGALKSVAEDVD